MSWIDPRFRTNPTRYIGQTLLAAASILIALLLSNVVENTVSIASLGASTFIAFTAPHNRLSKPKLLIGGYLIGTLTGSLSYAIANGLGLTEGALIYPSVMPFFGALAVGSAILLMVILDTEHPPAAGLALGYVVNSITLTKATAVIVAIIAVAALKTILKPRLIDLI